jgi:4-hydroxy-2-oxoheptanedioate aldolase
MNYTPNPLKEKLARGEKVYGTCICSFSPHMASLAGHCDFDFVRIDNEHAWRQDESLENTIRAALLEGVAPIVRIDKDEPYLARKALEVGALGLIIPEIKEASEVEAAVKAAKFPPRGERGFSTLCFSGQYGTADAAEWIEWSNRETLVGAMIEKPEAVEDIAAICAIDGLDFLLFGPADYSVAIGLSAPDKDHPSVQQAIAQTAEAAKKNGVHLMIGVAPPWQKETAYYAALGYDMIEIGHDYSVLARAWKGALADAKG